MKKLFKFLFVIKITQLFANCIEYKDTKLRYISKS